MSDETRLFFSFPPDSRMETLVGSMVELGEEQSHYVRDVLRKLRGETCLLLIDSAGRGRFKTTIHSTTPLVSLILGEFASQSPPSTPRLTLNVALLKGDHTSLVVEKCTELGVAEIFIWQGERSIPRLGDSDSMLSKTNRLQRVADAAALQSKRESRSTVLLFDSLATLLDYPTRREGTLLVASMVEGVQELSPDHLSTAPIHLFVGPEGDFSPEEYAVFRGKGAHFVTLGELRLRAETACIAGIASIQAISRICRS